jgi:Carboxypeptidase regulatory-like domain
MRLKIARVRRRFGWAVSAALGLSTAFAQQGGAVLTGAVKDIGGALIPRGDVTIINERTGAKIQVKVDDTGHFRVTALGRDFYTVGASSPGFSTATKKDIELKADVDLQFDLLVGTAGGPIFIESVAAASPGQLSTPAKPKPWWRRLL